jgi:uncharacterized Ntn-hydrolase superfamily protein
MNQHAAALTLLLGASAALFAQDTFSIVAVDPATGEVGSAGATCLDSLLEGTSAVIIARLHPGRGAINTQSFWNPINQNNASERLLEGLSPDEVIAWLEANDADGNAAIRQYGIADLDPSGQPRVASFTGADCFDWKGQDLGPNYAVQGNILSGRAILDSMAERFFFAEGDLANKLMAALQGANKVGADTRCGPEGVSSRSAFIQVARPGDSSSYYLNLVVGVTPFGVEPIDVLQDRFDTWREANPVVVPSGQNQPAAATEATALLKVRPNPAGPGAVLSWEGADFPERGLHLELANSQGQRLRLIMLVPDLPLNLEGAGLAPGVVWVQARSEPGGPVLSSLRFVYQP